MKRKLTTSQQKKKLWKIFSQFIRLRDRATCITCGKIGEFGEMHAGHYVPASVGGLALYFHEKNVHCQCPGCNLFRHGNLSVYALKLQKKYGDGILRELELERQKITKNFPFEKLIEDYTKRIEKLRR